MPVKVEPITAGELPAVGRFLHANLNERVAAEDWERAVQVPWKVPAPNHGFLLRDGQTVAGVYLAFYSERMIDGRTERFCNLAAWCVLPEYRFHGPRLLKALLGQDGYHFTDLSPSGNVPTINERLGFEFLDTSTALIPNLPWPSMPGRARVSKDPVTIEDRLGPAERQLYRDHAGAAAARHVILSRGDRSCYVIFRRDRRKGLPLFASVLYASDPVLLRELIRPFTRHLLLRHGIPATLAELRIIGGRPRWSVLLESPRPKMFRSPELAAWQIDNLYSELVCVAW